MVSSFGWLIHTAVGSAGEPTGSPNPFADSHYIYAVVLIVLAATYAGTTWGLGATWARLPFVNRNRWAL